MMSRAAQTLLAGHVIETSVLNEKSKMENRNEKRLWVEMHKNF